MHPLVQGDSGFTTADEGVHTDALEEEWIFTWWSPDGLLGGVTGYRLVGRSSAWYWWALARAGEPLLHVIETDIPRRSDPMIAKAQAMWAEYRCEAPFEQWTVGNETYAVLLDEPEEALGRVYGEAVPVASDLEWYATGPARAMAGSDSAGMVVGYEQDGVVHGVVELTSGVVEMTEVLAHRTHRWSPRMLGPWRPPAAVAHLGRRAPFRFPDGSTIDLVLTANGWRSRTVAG